MRIKILKYSDSSLWYSTKLGETLTVYRIEPTLYWCREDDEYGCLNFVLISDCEVAEYN